MGRSRQLVAICAFAYFYAFPYQPEINNPNENARFYMTAAIVELHTYQLDAIRARWGWTNDCAVHEGHVYSVKAPGTTLLGVPAYAAYYYAMKLLKKPLDRTTALWLVRATGSILPTLLFLFLMHRWLARRIVHGAVRDATIVSVGLGSLLFAYATMFVSHTLSAAVAFGAFMLLKRADEQGEQLVPFTWAHAFLAGLFTAGVTFFEYPGFIASIVLAVYALVVVRPRKLLLHFVLGGIGPTLAMMHFQWRCFGSPFRPGHLYIETTALREAHHEGFFGANGFHGEAAWKLLVHPYYGLFALTPFLIAAFVGVGILLARRADRRAAAFACALILLTYLVICTMNNWQGGWSVGPRYLAVAVPFVAWFAAVAFDALATRRPVLATSLALGSTLASVVASGVPSLWYPHVPNPPDFDFPLHDLYGLLIAHDFAPSNFGNWLDVYGTWSMVPALLCLAGAVVWAGFGARSWRDRAVGLCAAVPLALVCLAPLWVLAPRRSDATLRSTAFVVSTWTPRGHDLAATLSTRTTAHVALEPGIFERLAQTYMDEGRENEARMTGARAMQMRAGLQAHAARVNGP